MSLSAQDIFGVDQAIIHRFINQYALINEASAHQIRRREYNISNLKKIQGSWDIQYPWNESACFF